MSVPEDTRDLAKERTAEASENSSNPVAGIDASQGATRTGDDARKRGWFWHWNAIVTQFAPLVGLKGIGLLNSYTVWTDRRAESPHRGYAFPSQQKEADFYGEERSELITINKILVTLDLIEIRKEMVLRADEAGRKWRVPHNFYRVKDRDDGFTLTPEAVYRVVELADSDRGVYRYVRHIFSPKFSPIDANNVWKDILAELHQLPVWVRLSEKTRKEEERNSARTKAGHRSRRSGSQKSSINRERTTPKPDNDSNAVPTEGQPETSVAHSNKGSVQDVAPTNNGSGDEIKTSVDTSNEGRPTAVGQSNRTYNQKNTTTTTEGATSEKSDERQLPVEAANGGIQASESVGPGNREAPRDAVGEAAAYRAFRDANERELTRAEKKLLRDLAERFDPAARETGELEKKSGWAWVSAAIYEAVESGSTFVAPRRVREILARWEREGLPSDEGTSTSRTKSAQHRPLGRSQPIAITSAQPSNPVGAEPHLVEIGNVEPFLIPESGMSNEQVWGAVLDEIERGGRVGRANFEGWLRPTRLIGRSADGGFVVGAPNAHSVQRLEAKFDSAIRSAVQSVVGQNLTIAFANSRTWGKRIDTVIDDTLLVDDRGTGSEMAGGE